MSEPADREWGAFETDAPVGARSHPHRLARGRRPAARRGTARGAGAHRTGAAATRSPCRHRCLTSAVGRRPLVVASQAPQVRRPGGRTSRHLEAPAPGGGSARGELHQARPDHLLRRGALPARARGRVQEVPRPGAARAVRRRAPHDRGGPRPSARRRVRVDRRDRPRRGVDRPGPRCPPAHGRGRGGQGPAPGRGEARAHRPEDDGVAGTAPRGEDPGGGARQPTGAGRVVRRDDRRGARLPARSRRTCSTSPPCSASSVRTATSCRVHTRRW